MESRWGNDPEPIEDSRAVQNKLLWLALFLGASATPFAFSHWMWGETGFKWPMCVLASISGAVVMALFSRAERIPVAAGIIPGLVAGYSIYAMTVGYVSFRQSVRVFELLIPTFFGSIPGIVLYFIIVRAYYWYSDR